MTKNVLDLPERAMWVAAATATDERADVYDKIANNLRKQGKPVVGNVEAEPLWLLYQEAAMTERAAWNDYQDAKKREGLE